MNEELNARLAKARATPRAKTPSLRAAINAHCKACTYDPLCGGGTWRQQVEACTITHCELHSVRPRSKSAKEGLAQT